MKVYVLRVSKSKILKADEPNEYEMAEGKKQKPERRSFIEMDF